MNGFATSAPRRIVLGSLALGPLFAAACSGGGDASRAAEDRRAAKVDWRLVVEDGGTTHAFALERMDIYVAEDDDVPEIFEIIGQGVTLVGEFAPDLRVGYEEAFGNLVGKRIELSATGGDPRVPKRSSILIGEDDIPVSGGSLHVERQSGRWSGQEGDRTLHGKVELHLQAGDGSRTVRGHFAVHAVTWG